jgi:hypothetical protein
LPDPLLLQTHETMFATELAGFKVQPPARF